MVQDSGIASPGGRPGLGGAWDRGCRKPQQCACPFELGVTGISLQEWDPQGTCAMLPHLECKSSELTQ